MITLRGKHLHLRGLEPKDIDLLELTENDESLWHLSSTVTPFSRYQLEQYILNANSDLYESKQLRLVISRDDGEALGFIDLYNFDPLNMRAGIGIIIVNQRDRGKGYAKEAIELLISYAFKRLNLHQLYCQVQEDNTQSISLFEGMGFKKTGHLKDWSYWENRYHNEWVLQLINKDHVL